MAERGCGRRIGSNAASPEKAVSQFASILGWLAIGAALILAAAVSRAVAAAAFVFPRPAAIEPNIKFWVNVFTAYSERDFIIHDREHVWRIYQVMHLPGEGGPTRADIDSVNEYLKTKYGNILNRLAAGELPANYEERRVAELFKGEGPGAYALAAQNLRVQQGMREQFRQGLLRSRYYDGEMEQIFRDAGLPQQLVALAEIESGFSSRARSNAGAVGIWQFTRGTGRQFMRITRYHDDRLNPTTETQAAAALLRSNYLTFGSWPLAITAYDYGTAGTEQATEQFAGDYARIVRDYAGPHFGFASQNYYAEFLAALQVRRYQEAYFPGIEYEEAPPPPPVRTDFARAHHPRRHYARRYLRRYARRYVRHFARRRILRRVSFRHRHRPRHRRHVVA